MPDKPATAKPAKQDPLDKLLFGRASSTRSGAVGAPVCELGRDASCELAMQKPCKDLPKVWSLHTDSVEAK